MQNYGELTEEEKSLGFGQLFVENEDKREYPNEENVIEIAKLWGVDPTFSKNNYEKSTGFVCKIKEI